MRLDGRFPPYRTVRLGAASSHEDLPVTMRLYSPAFRPGGTIPKAHTADGADCSPPLAWTDPPARVESFAVICDDPDAPRSTWVHWVLFDLPGDARGLDGGLPPTEVLVTGGRQGRNDFGSLGYGGPAPPPGAPHRYSFRLYALDAPLGLLPGATKAQVLSAANGHVLEEVELIGTYGR